MKKWLFIIFVLATTIFLMSSVKADQIDDLGAQITALQNDLKNKEINYSQLQTQIEGIKNRVVILEQEIVTKEEEVAQGEKALVYQKQLLEERVRSYYKNINKNSLSLVNLLISENISISIENLFYNKTAVDEDKNMIIKIVLYIKNLEAEKADIESEKTRLAALKVEIDRQSNVLAAQIENTKQQIAQLTAQQQQLIAQKLASLNISRSAATLGRCDSDLTNGRDPGFGPKFGLFTYGVPNRVGLNQWGAYGRAQAGQSYDQILHAYYNFDGYQNFDVNTKINVDGYGSYSLEDYVKRIYEVPDGWPMDALRAQAIAARSFALAYTNKGAGSICATESCQVFQPDPKGGSWDQAVNDTAGKVMIQGGNPIKAWFSSTHGGYVHTSGEIGWSNTGWTKHAVDASGGVSSFSDLQNNAFDKASPWFYCDWGSRPQYNKTAWLQASELADIANVLMLAKRDSSTQEHLYQPDNPPSGTDTWSADRVKSELRNRGGNPFNNVTNVSVSVDYGAGRTTSVTVSGDADTQTFDGSEFKNFFNLRAPANIQIVGPLYNAEKR